MLFGIASILPMLAGFFWCLNSKNQAAADIRLILNTLLRPVMGSWSHRRWLCIALLAGVSEELLFRGAIQGGLESSLGTTFAWILASLLFGLAHPLSSTYFLLTTLMGAYLGGLYLVTGNLLVPMVAHAAYDYFALYAFFRRRSGNQE